MTAGSSPRGRGTGESDTMERRGYRFIPAWAGNSQRSGWPPAGSSVHPRVGGEQGGLAGPPAGSLGSSPRGRGTVGPRPLKLEFFRFIPAWAGNSGR